MNVLDFLLKEKDEQNNTALHLACVNKHPDVTDLLLRHKLSVSEVNNEGQSPLHLASENGCLECVNLLIRNGSGDAKILNQKNRSVN